MSRARTRSSTPDHMLVRYCERLARLRTMIELYSSQLAILIFRIDLLDRPEDSFLQLLDLRVRRIVPNFL